MSSLLRDLTLFPESSERHWHPYYKPKSSLSPLTLCLLTVSSVLSRSRRRTVSRPANQREDVRPSRVGRASCSKRSAAPRWFVETETRTSFSRRPERLGIDGHRRDRAGRAIDGSVAQSHGRSSRRYESCSVNSCEDADPPACVDAGCHRKVLLGNESKRPISKTISECSAGWLHDRNRVRGDYSLGETFPTTAERFSSNPVLGGWATLLLGWPSRQSPIIGSLALAS